MLNKSPSDFKILSCIVISTELCLVAKHEYYIFIDHNKFYSQLAFQHLYSKLASENDTSGLSFSTWKIEILFKL